MKTDRLPILLYHSIADEGPAGLAPWRVTTGAFEQQLAWLRDSGYRSIGLDEWRGDTSGDRTVILTFDDAYADFASNAWPALERLGFSATVLVVTDAVGGANRWSTHGDEPVPLMGWDEIGELESAGVSFGSHCASHRRLTSLPADEAARELSASMAALRERLRHPLGAVAYPYGDVDSKVQDMARECGYAYGLTCRSAPAGLDDDPIALPRIEIEGSDTLDDFVAKVA